MAQIGWIDFSREDRDKVKRIMAAIRPEGQLDELGVGRVRDALANKLFPGLSTIQTRAKYFFIVPYIIREYISLPASERKKTKPELYLENKQHEIKNRLRELYKGKENTGIIGVTLSEQSKIVRPPSVIYWVGIQTFRCMQTNGLSISSYLRNLHYLNPLENTYNEDKSDIKDDADAICDGTYNSILVPRVHPDWKEQIDIELTKTEAQFLKAALSEKKNPYLTNSVLSEIFLNNSLLELFCQEKNFQEFARKAVRLPDISPILKADLILAHDFSYLIHGAHILYNHMLQEHFFKEQYDSSFLLQFRQWLNELKTTLIHFSGFQINALRHLAGYDFFDLWWKYVNEAFHAPDATLPKMEELIRQRERISKNKKARLQNSRETNPDMKPGKWIGLQLLSFRYGNAKRIIDDIINGEKNA